MNEFITVEMIQDEEKDRFRDIHSGGIRVTHQNVVELCRQEFNMKHVCRTLLSDVELKFVNDVVHLKLRKGYTGQEACDMVGDLIWEAYSRSRPCLSQWNG